MTDPIRLIDLPGVAELEEALNVRGWHLLPEYDGLEDRIARLSRRLFGIADDDTGFTPRPDEIQERFGADRYSLTATGSRRKQEWEAHFDFLESEEDFTDPQEDLFWEVMGWDVTDGEDCQLAILAYFGRPLVCVLKRLHPKARFEIDAGTREPVVNVDPERDAEQWGAKLAEDARRFKSSR